MSTPKGQAPVKVHSFTLVIGGRDSFSELSDDELDALYRGGCLDASFGERNGRVFGEFDREAASLGEAIVSAIEQVEGAVPGLRVVRVEPVEDLLVSAAGIAKRTGRSRESIRLLINGRRGPGRFPLPVVDGGGRPLWQWNDVAEWFASAKGESYRTAESAGFLAAVNDILDLRERARGRTGEERRALARLARRGSTLLTKT